MAERAKQGRLNAAIMYPLMELFEQSGMTQKQFYVKKNIVPHTFTYWLTKFRKSNQLDGQPKERKSFVALEISEPSEIKESLRVMRITYPGGTIIELPV